MKQPIELESIVLRLIEKLQESECANLGTVQRYAFLVTNSTGFRDDLDYSIYQYGPYSFRLEEKVDELLSNGVLLRFGSHLFVNSAGITPTSHDQYIGRLTKELENVSATELEAMCNVLFFDSGSEEEAIGRALQVTPGAKTSSLSEAYKKGKALMSLT